MLERSLQCQDQQHLMYRERNRESVYALFIFTISFPFGISLRLSGDGP